MTDWVCEPLAKHHDRSAFNCGVSVLNEYLAKYAREQGLDLRVARGRNDRSPQDAAPAPMNLPTVAG